MSTPYDRYERSTRRAPQPHRNAFGHWVPLILTVTVATIGLAAWVWSERTDDDEDGRDPRRPRNDDGVYPRPPPAYGDMRQGETTYIGPPRPTEESSSYMARMSGALKRTPSPQQFIDGASRAVVGGMAAAGAVVGNALSSIREEDKNAYKDHKTWSEEAESRKPGQSPKIKPAGVVPKSTAHSKSSSSQGNGRRKTVAVVVSADADNDGFDDGADYSHTHASILSHLPRNTDFSKIRLFVLIYSPDLKDHPLDTAGPRPPGSLSSSFSIVGHEQTYKPGEEITQSLPKSSMVNTAFGALWSEAQAIVEKETMILPFTTSGGHIHVLRHLNPDCVYLQESLAGKDGDVITHLQSWLRQDVVLVVGADGGSGGLADSESEAEQVEKSEQWWEKEERVGRGRGIVVVEGLRVGDDWARRIEGRE